MSHLAYLGLLLLCMIGSAFFAGIETGVLAFNRLRLRHLVQHGVKGARVVEDLLRHPDRLLGTTLIGTNLFHVAMAVTAARWFIHLRLPAAETLSGMGTTLVLLVFGEYLPKAWFQAFPAHRVLPFAFLLEWCARILAPFRWVLQASFRGLRRTEGSSSPLLTREELVELATEGSRAGILSPVEARMITGVITIGGVRCRDIMVPLERVVVTEESTPIPELLAVARQTGFSRFPVRRSGREEMIGVVSIYDVLADPNAERKLVRDFLRHPQFVSVHTMADHVLPRMRVTKQPMMLVADEAGRVVGIITVEDVLKVMVGDDRVRLPAQGTSIR